MDLSNESILRVLLSGDERRPRMHRTHAAPEFRRIQGPRRCNCGECRQCEDNARWERIFQEKFADPDYYTNRPRPKGSSLTGL